MRIALLPILALVASIGHSQPSTPADVAEVKALEIRLWDAWRTRDLPTWQDLTDPSYSWSDGKDRKDYAAIRKEFDTARLEEYRTSEMQSFDIAPGVIALSYRAFFRGTLQNKPIRSNVSECSVWVRRDGKWRNVLLQEVETDNRKVHWTASR